MYSYKLKCVLYTPEQIELPKDFFGTFPKINLDSSKYLGNYKHANNKSSKIRRRSSVAQKNNGLVKNIPPTPIHTTQSHSSHGLEDQVDFRLGPLEIHETNIIPTSKKKKRMDEKTHQLGYGLLHLYRSPEAVPEQQELIPNDTNEEHETVLCILAVPSYLTYKDFTDFLGAANASITHYRFIR